MRHYAIILTLSVFTLMVSCKEKDKKTTTDENSVVENSASADKTENINPTSTANDENKNAHWEQRKANGDTLALPYKDLQAYLPDISGYKKDGGPKGSQMNMPGMGSWSQTEQNYISGEKKVSVKMVDYNGAYNTLQGVTAVYGMAFSFEDDSKKQQKVDMGFKDVAAYETIYKNEKRAELAILAADRFFITIDIDGDNDEGFVKNVAKSINLEKMAGM